MDTTRKVARNTLFNFVATAAEALITLVIGVVLARGLGTESYGLYALLMWFLSWASLLVNLGLGEMAKRYIAESVGQQSQDAPSGIVRLVLMIRGSAAVVVAGVIVVSAGFWATTFADPADRGLFALLGLILIPNVLTLALVSIFAGFQKYEYGAYVMLGAYPVRAVLVLAVVLLGFGVREVLLANIAAWAVGAMLGVFLLGRVMPRRRLLSSKLLTPETRSRALKYSLTVMGVLAVTQFMQHNAEVMFIGLFRTVEEVGFFTLATKIPSTLIALAPVVLGRVLLPTIAEQFGRGDLDKVRSIYRTASRYLMLLALPLAAAGVALAEPVIRVLYGADYLPAALVMQIVFIPYALGSLRFAATSVIYGVHKPSFMLVTGLIVAAVNIGLNIWLIPRYGIVGAAIGGSISRVLILPIFVRFASKQVSASWPMADSARIAGAALLMGGLLFLVQESLGSVLGLALAAPLGLLSYGAALLLLRAIRRGDIAVFRRVQGLLPGPLRRIYGAVIDRVERLVRD